MLSVRRPTCLSTKPFWADSQIHLGSLEKRLLQWDSINTLLFSQAEAQWFKAPFVPQRNSDHAFVIRGRRFVLQELHLESIIHLRLQAESQDVMERCWQTSMDSHTIGFVASAVPSVTTYRTVIPAKSKSHGRMYSSFGMPNQLGNCLREARRSIHGGLNTMVTCRRLTPGSNRKKRHVRHVHSRLHLARRFATHRACFQKEYFIDEKVRFNGVREQGFGVQIISGAHKPNQAGHKWNQLKVVTNTLLDVALTASSAFMRAIPLIEEGVQHVHPVNKHLQSFLRSWTHEAFSVQKPTPTR